MSRNLTASVITELGQSDIRWALLVEVNWNGGTTRLWTGVGDLSWDGNTWTGAGDLLAVEPGGETADVRALGLKLSLSGVNSSYVSLVLGSAERGRAAKVWCAFLDDSGAVIADPFLVFAGRVDVPEIDRDGATATITIGTENRLVDLQRPRQRRYTPEDQKLDYSSDTGFDFVPVIQSMDLHWGRSVGLHFRTRREEARPSRGVSVGPTGPGGDR